MANSVQNAANYKVRRVEKDDQKPFRPLYMDGAATTPIDPRVLDAMLPFQTSYYGNPHSVSHAYGWQAEAAVERAREEVTFLFKILGWKWSFDYACIIELQIVIRISDCQLNWC